MRPGLPPIPPPRGRPAWVVPVLAGVLAVLVLAAGGLLALRAGGGNDPGPAAAAPQSAPPTIEPSPTAAPPSPEALPAPVGGPVDFEGAILTLPAGWRLEDDGIGSACVSRAQDTCDLQLVLPDVVRARGGELEDPATDADQGWYLGTDVPDCRASSLEVRDLAPFDDKRAEYREWELDCTGAPTRLRMWWLPRTRFAALDRTGVPALRPVVDEIVRTTDLAGLRAG